MAKALSRICFFMIEPACSLIFARSNAGLCVEIVASRRVLARQILARTALPAAVISRYVGSTRNFATGKQAMTRADAIAGARQQLHSGEFLGELGRRVAYRTESQNPERRDVLRAYLVD